MKRVPRVVHFSADVTRRLKARAKREDTSISEIVRRAVHQFLAKRPR